MEAIGAVASIIGVAGAGAKLSIVLFEFASTVGSAGEEARQIGIEISLFCSVLKQLQSVLTKANACRYSLSAIETTQEILDRCQEIFKEIEAIVVGLSLRKNNDERSGEATRKLISKVKWTFKRSHVQLLRTTLEPCKVTLHIMLSTLEFAQKIATRSALTPETEAEDEGDEIMTRSLIIAHQCTVDTLQRLEDEVQQQPTESDPISPPLTPGTPPLSRVVRVPSRRRPSQLLDDQNIRFPSPTKDLANKRASVWINSLIFDNSPLPLGFRRQTWGDTECSLFLDQQPFYFLQKWTDQGEHLNELRRESIKYQVGRDMEGIPINVRDKETTPVRTEPLLNFAINSEVSHQQKNLSTSPRTLGSVPEISVTQSAPYSKYNPNLDTGSNGSKENPPLTTTKYNLEGMFSTRKRPPRRPSRLHLSSIKRSNDTQQSPKIPNATAQSQDQNSNGKLQSVPSPNGVEIFKSFRVSMEDPCHKVLPAAMKMHNINEPWEQYALYLIYDEYERCLAMDEKPLILFKQLDKEGKRPTFMLRKIVDEARVDLTSLQTLALQHSPYNNLPGGMI